MNRRHCSVGEECPLLAWIMNLNCYVRQGRISDVKKYNHTTARPDLRDKAPDPSVFTSLIGNNSPYSLLSTFFSPYFPVDNLKLCTYLPEPNCKTPHGPTTPAIQPRRRRRRKKKHYYPGHKTVSDETTHLSYG